MSLKKKAGFIAALLISAGLAALAWNAGRRSLHVQTIENSPSQSATPATAKKEVALPIAETPVVQEVRRDQDFWPQQPHVVELRKRSVLPSREIDAAILADSKAHVWLIQFGGPLTDANKATLKKEFKIETLFPSVAMCFYARATASDLADAASRATPALTGWARLEASDKILSAGASHDDELKAMRVELYPDGNLRNVAARIRAGGGEVLEQGQNWLAVNAGQSRGLALHIAALDDVYTIEPARSKMVIHDTQAEASSDATPLFSTPYNLTGAGITVMVRDEGKIFAHPDLGNRVLFAADVSSQQPVQHATHVAGTIAGDGSSIPAAGARGFAPSCSVVSYDLNGDESAEPMQAFQTYGAVISNHSYGFATGWDDSTGTFTNNQATFGLYASFARNWDNLVRGQNLILIKSAGNSRDGNGAGEPHNGMLAADGEYYNTVDESGTSKNVLVVGAASDNAMAGSPSASKMVLAFSSSGPTSDGRLRPEIIANGDTLLSCDNTPVTGNTYISLSGTSMAAASATGTTALFMQRYKQIFGTSSACTPHYLRAVYAQTATDFGTPGPDYLHGFGMLDAFNSIGLLNADAGSGQRIVTSTISASAPQRFFLLSSDGSTPIKGTLCWSDDPGDALAKKTLVNDLDLRLVKVDDQTVYFPFTLDPTAPEQPAKPGINTVDTIEQVLFAAPPAGNYLLAVRGTTLISTTPFALASSHAINEVQPPVPIIIPSATSGPPPFTVTFDGSNSSAAPGASIVHYTWSFGDGNSAEGVTVQHTYLQGLFQAVLKVTDSRGTTASSSVTISVANKPPVAALSASPSSGGAPLNVLLSTDGSADPDGTIQSFAMDFGDGTTGTGANPSHAYMSPGLYTPTLTVTDNGGATGTRSTTVYVGEVYLPTTSRFALNFAKPSKDTFTIATRSLGIAPNIVTAGLHGTVFIGQASYDFILDSKGNYRSPLLTVRLVPLHAQMTIRLAQANLASGLIASNVNNITVKKQNVFIPFAVNLDGGLSFGSVGLPFSYTAKQGTRGTGTFIKTK